MTDMHTTEKECDPMGRAIADYYHTGRAGKLRVFSSMFYEDKIPVATLFRKFADMPPQEQKMLEMARGRVLDVGAGSGCHSVELANMGLKDVVAIDISRLSVDVMIERGVDARCVNFFDDSFSETFDTIIMPMNGIGIVGKLDKLPLFFSRAKRLLRTGGQILLDSSDIRYVFEDEDGNMDADSFDGYYGEVDYKMRYRDVQGEPFDWLYIDFRTLSERAALAGFKCELCAEGNHYDYLARLVAD